MPSIAISRVIILASILAFASLFTTAFATAGAQLARASDEAAAECDAYRVAAAASQASGVARATGKPAEIVLYFAEPVALKSNGTHVFASVGQAERAAPLPPQLSGWAQVQVQQCFASAVRVAAQPGPALVTTTVAAAAGG